MDVELDDVTLTYGDFCAVDGLSLQIAHGESLVLLGPSGCGKTSTMRCVAGLETPASGRLAIGGTDVYNSATGVNVPPNKRNVGLVFQSYAVWPHMTVFENVAFPLRMKRSGNAQTRRAAVTKTLELVGLAHLADQGASLLSGGQMQRVALARSLMMEPSVLLLDEPLSNLDAMLRDELRTELRRLHLELGITSVYVTHDQGEALALADRIAVMEKGRISQLSAPKDLYTRPSTATVARFLGVGNVFPVEPAGDGASWRLRDQPAYRVNGVDESAGAPEVSACFRPEHVEIHREPVTGPNTWIGRVVVTVFQGSYTRVTLALDDGPHLEIHAEASAAALAPGDPVHVRVRPEHVRIIAERIGSPPQDADQPRLPQDAAT